MHSTTTGSAAASVTSADGERQAGRLSARGRCATTQEAIEHYLADIPTLRFRPTGKSPYLVFYVETELEVDVWRVLHGSRDIPSWLR